MLVVLRRLRVVFGLDRRAPLGQPRSSVDALPRPASGSSVHAAICSASALSDLASSLSSSRNCDRRYDALATSCVNSAMVAHERVTPGAVGLVVESRGIGPLPTSACSTAPIP